MGRAQKIKDLRKRIGYHPSMKQQYTRVQGTFRLDMRSLRSAYRRLKKAIK